MAAMTMPRSIAFSRATASAIWRSSSRLALTAIVVYLRRAFLGRLGLTGRSGALRHFLGLPLFGAKGLSYQFVGKDQSGFLDLRKRHQRVRGILGGIVFPNGDIIFA